MKPPLPRPDVNVRTDGDATRGYTADVVVRRDNPGGAASQRSYRGTSGTSTDAAVADALGQVLGDGYTAEWLP